MGEFLAPVWLVQGIRFPHCSSLAPGRFQENDMTASSFGILLLLLLLTGLADVQVIDFETLPDGSPVSEGMLIHDQYNVAPYWVHFELVGQDPALGPRAANVGSPLEAFYRTTASSNECITGTTRHDMPTPGEPVGCYFLTDDGHQNTQPYVFLVTYTQPAYQASGQILDVDAAGSTTDEWTVTAYDSDGITVLGQVVIRAGDPGTGDGLASTWAFDLAEAIHTIEIVYTGSSGAGVGFALDNFAPSSLPADLSMTKVGPSGPVAVGDTLMYSLTVTNSGPGNADDVYLQDVLPQGVLFLSADPTVCQEDGGVLTCDLGSIPNGGSTVIEITTLLSELFIVNTASVSATQADLDESDNTDTAATPVDCMTARAPMPEEWMSTPTLNQGRPSLFENGTVISFSLPRRSDVHLRIFDVAGRVIRTHSDRLDAGEHGFTWHGEDDFGRMLPTGTYFYRLEVDGIAVGSRKAIILR